MASLWTESSRRPVSRASWLPSSLRYLQGERAAENRAGEGKAEESQPGDRAHAHPLITLAPRSCPCPLELSPPADLCMAACPCGQSKTGAQLSGLPDPGTCSHAHPCTLLGT